MTPEEFREVSNGKAVNTITALIITLKGGKAFPPKSDFFKLRSWAKKQDRFTINILYDYLSTLDKSDDTLSIMLAKAEKHRQNQYQKQTEITRAYPDITLKDVLNM